MNQFDAFARYYDADYGAIDDDLPFYRELARRCDGRVLEVMCGSGRLLEPLARDGHRVAGVEVLAEHCLLVQHARQQAIKCVCDSGSQKEPEAERVAMLKNGGDQEWRRADT